MKGDTFSSRRRTYAPLRVGLSALLVGLVISAGASSAAAETEFEVGALIIPMDTDYQDWGTLRAFGLVYALLRNNIPVNWVIDPDKSASISEDNFVTSSPDFTAEAVDLETGETIAPAHGYRAGPFVIDAMFATEARVVIDAFWAEHPITEDPLRNVVVHVATAPFSGTVSRRLVVAPTIAMFADGNEDIAREYCQAAAIPDSTGDFEWPDDSPDMLSEEEVMGTKASDSDGALFDSTGNPKYCQLMSMHWGGSGDEDFVVAEVRSYLTHPVHFFAECAAVNTFENNPNGLFLTLNGFKVGHPGDPYAYLHPEQPFAQLDGPFEGAGGSEPGYSVCSAGGCLEGEGFKTDNVVMLTDAGSTPQTGREDLWMTGFLDGACPLEAAECLSGSGTGGVGKVSYLGGHSYDTKLPISQESGTNGTRLFLQSLFEAPCATQSGHPRVHVEKAGPAVVTDGQLTWTIAYRNDGPSAILDAVLSDTLPPGASFVEASGDYTEADGVITWSVGSLGAGGSGTVLVTADLASYGVYENAAVLSYKVGLNDLSTTSEPVVTNYDADTDVDGVIDALDNCPDHYNPLQDLLVDPQNCGTCGHQCEVANGATACVEGACIITACDEDFDDCNADVDDGCEYDVTGFSNDLQHCGGCNTPCALAHAEVSCESSTCVLSACETGWVDCNGDPSDGCEYAAADFDADLANCGGCGVQCAPANAFGACELGACDIGSCFPGASDCNSDASDGCEFDEARFKTDPNHCGGCDQACEVPQATAGCASGACTVGTCDQGFSDCNGASVDGCEYVDAGFLDDPNHCGGCGQVCDPANGSGACASGTCELLACDEGWVDCNGEPSDGCEQRVADFAWDADNCGGCGQACDVDNAAPACMHGACQVMRCDDGWSDCNGDPTDGCELSNATFIDTVEHCGGCNRLCAPSNGAGTCVSGSCAVASCAEGWTDCNGVAADGCEFNDSGFDADRDNCGGCGQLCHPVHAVGGCAAGVCEITSCTGAFRDCNGDATDGCEYNMGGFVDDAANCGGCDIVCEAPNAEAICVSGMCAVGACDAGRMDCDGQVDNGCEQDAADFATDAENCGSCGVVCSVANGTGACVEGVCATGGCDDGYEDCDGRVDNGCEYPSTALASDPSNCGSCGAMCDPANADGECVAGACVMGACANGWSDCNGDASDGCEVASASLVEDDQNCGVCGNVCAGENASTACRGGTCVITECSEGWADCDGQPHSGCESATASFSEDPANCGACGNACAYDNGVGSCVNGVCSAGGCDIGWADCNGILSDGCEYPTDGMASDDTNCGACGAVCNPQHALGECQEGACMVLSCDPGFTDCDGDNTNGCEFETANFMSDPFNCGSCAASCLTPDGPRSCDAGTCFVGTCPTGMADCNGEVGDLCEYDIAAFETDPLNCGACGVDCAADNATGSCVEGACAVTCASGFLNCNDDASDGCEYAEAALLGDPENCGGCGVVCTRTHASSNCEEGACTIVACDDGFTDADRDASNGCELECTPIAEADATCDRVDDDCDGTADDDYVTTSTGCGMGACAANGSQTCVDGAIIDDCSPGTPSEESNAVGACSDNVDNDCDGLIDLDDLDCENCAFDTDCDDGDPCTDDACLDGTCRTTPVQTSECGVEQVDAGLTTDTADSGSFAESLPGEETGASSTSDSAGSESGCMGSGAPRQPWLWLLLALGLLVWRRRAHGTGRRVGS